MAVSAVFQIDQPEYDNDCVTVPLDALRRLLEYRADEASAIDIGLEPGADAARVASDIGAMLGDGFDVLSRERQQADTFRMISVEKWITFLMLVFILVVASFNIVSTLSLMVIEKRYDMATLRSLGASRSTVRRVFIAEGWLITAVGGLVGIALGVGLSLLQERFGSIRLDGDPAALSVEAYPVRLEWGDVGMVLATVVVVGFAIAQLSRLFTRKIGLKPRCRQYCFTKLFFGPIHSRRLGASLGINPMPNDGKICSFDCLYCEAGYNAQGAGTSGLPREKKCGNSSRPSYSSSRPTMPRST